MESQAQSCLTTIDLPGITKVSSGKVREIFELDDKLLLVASDRISAFDVILPNPVPYKGTVLTQMAYFWFQMVASEQLVDHHVVTVNASEFPSRVEQFKAQLAGRTTLAHRCNPLPIECVVRGYLAGSGWKEYQENGQVCGIRLPDGLVESDKLPEPIFTPATKAASGHDENITFGRTVEIVGEEIANQVKDLSIAIYEMASNYARTRGIIICDTKFEFGMLNNKLVLIDEVLTPDSSRFWPAALYSPGGAQQSFDKQFIRDYLETLDWDKIAPGPQIPQEIIAATSERYLEAYRQLTGKELEIA